MIRGKAPFLSRVPLTMASIMLGWSEPRLTKTCSTPASHSSSKKANDAVYILVSPSGCCVSVDAARYDVAGARVAVACSGVDRIEGLWVVLSEFRGDEVNRLKPAPTVPTRRIWVRVAVPRGEARNPRGRNAADVVRGIMSDAEMWWSSSLGCWRLDLPQIDSSSRLNRSDWPDPMVCHEVKGAWAEVKELEG